MSPVKTGALIFCPQYQMYFWCDAWIVGKTWVFRCSEGSYSRPKGTYETDADVSLSNKSLSWAERGARQMICPPGDVKVWEGSQLWCNLKAEGIPIPA